MKQKLMTHLVVGYPTLKATEKIAEVLQIAGTDIIELQIPFSDPLADGPVIMKACEESLKNGTRVKDVFETAKKIKVPVYLMAYYNLVFKFGVTKFCAAAKDAGVVGLIVPDMPIEAEKQEHFMAECRKNDLLDIHVISPASTIERLKINAKYSRGFIYCTARQGITGTEKVLDPKIKAYLKRVRKYFKVPIAVGFGISSAQRVKQVKPYCDIVVVGSAITKVCEENLGNPEKTLPEIAKFVMSLKKVM